MSSHRLLMACLCSLTAIACGGSDDWTYTIVQVQAEHPDVERVVVAMTSVTDTSIVPFTTEVKRAQLPTEYSLSPRNGDASRTFEINVEGFDAQGTLLHSTKRHAGFVKGETRYLKAYVLEECDVPLPESDELAPLAESLDAAPPPSCDGDTPGGVAGSDPDNGGSVPVAGSDAGSAAGGDNGAPVAGNTGGSTPNPGTDGAGSGSNPSTGGTGGAGGNTTPPNPATCGNKRLDAGETCDTGIASGAGACPRSCAARNGCVIETLVGAGTCQAECTQTQATDGDCGDGPVCGNGVVETGETCDPPAACASLCSAANLGKGYKANPTGTAAQCNVKCNPTPITECKGGDSFCPSNCTRTNDSDCAGCGDGLIDTSKGETCELTGSGKRCSDPCPADNGCSVYRRQGSENSCNVECIAQTINVPANGDGCCPAGQNYTTDHDCAGCGNGTVEQGELCDGDCPANCDGYGMCYTLGGSDCQRQCSKTKLDPSTVCGADFASDTSGACSITLCRTFASNLGTHPNESNQGVELLTDGIEGTLPDGRQSRWISAPTGAGNTITPSMTLDIDLGKSYTLTRIRIVWAADTTKTYGFAVSDDRQNWQEFYTGDNPVELQRSERVYMASDFEEPAIGRYFQIRGYTMWPTAISGQYGHSIWEVQLWGE